MTEYKSILVMLLAGAGDTLLTTPLLRELKAAFPEAEIEALVMQGPSACEVLQGDPSLARMHYHDFRAESMIASLRKCYELRKRKFDAVILPMPHNRGAYSMIAALIGGRERIGFEYAIHCGSMGRLVFCKRIKEDTFEHVVENNLRVITEGFGRELKNDTHELVLHIESKNEKFADKFLKDMCMEHGNLVAIHAGSGTTKNLVLKRWPPEKWAELVKAMVDKYKVRVLILGRPEEDPLKKKIIELSGLDSSHVVSVDGGTVHDMASLIKRCRIVVSGDTLVPHVSAAVGTPSVVIYGPTSHLSAFPYGVRYELVWSGLPCSPCYGFSRYGIRCTNKVFLECMKLVDVKMVMEAVDKLFTDGDECAGN